jgi:hypothetical protein
MEYRKRPLDSWFHLGGRSGGLSVCFLKLLALIELSCLAFSEKGGGLATVHQCDWQFSLEMANEAT